MLRLGSSHAENVRDAIVTEQNFDILMQCQIPFIPWHLRMFRDCGLEEQAWQHTHRVLGRPRIMKPFLPGLPGSALGFWFNLSWSRGRSPTVTSFKFSPVTRSALRPANAAFILQPAVSTMGWLSIVNDLTGYLAA